MNSFQENLQNELAVFTSRQQATINQADSIRIDLHCHDFNSDVTDELWGRILRIPETYLPTKTLLRCLRENGTQAITVTNHNNARSCWQLMSSGIDVLSGAEFTCLFPEMGVHVHVLVYGFTPTEESALFRLRQDIYRFLAYTVDHNLPAVLAHPLYVHVDSGHLPPPAYLEKIAVMFECFEVLNGQRDAWQNLLMGSWINSLNEEYIRNCEKKHGINSLHFCRRVWPKRMTGGSDDHMGLFAGLCGTVVQIEKQATSTDPMSSLVLDALRQGKMAPYGHAATNERMNIAFLDYLCQVGLNMKDPGLLRMFLHQGDLKDKLLCLFASNAIQELRRHRHTSRFFNLFHEALHGKKPGLMTQWSIAKDYKPIVDKLADLANTRKTNSQELGNETKKFVSFAFSHLNRTVLQRVDSKVKPMIQKSLVAGRSYNDIISKLEVPSHLRSLLSSEEDAPPVSLHGITRVNMLEIFDQLSFPALFSTTIAASILISTRVLFNQRDFLNNLAGQLGRYHHPRRILWLTDTLTDKNGVSHALRTTLSEVQRRDLPIDFLVCSDKIAPEPHLVVTPSIGHFHLFDFEQQRFNIPNLEEIHRLFVDGGYDRVICSTEFLMGPVALYLKAAFSVPTYFYMHTDWMEFFAKNTDLDEHNLDRIRRLLRAFYRAFSGIIVLNNEQECWLASPAMGISKESIFKTAHWTEKSFFPTEIARTELFPGIEANSIVLLYAGRLNEEKGVMELPHIYEELKTRYANLKMVIAGTGPLERQLQEALPDSIFLGWVETSHLVKIYSAADLLILPSRFDTFGLVILEAQTCGLPVAAYSVKGPGDLIMDGINGITASRQEELVEKIARLLSSPATMDKMKVQAVKSAKLYDPVIIMDKLLKDVGLYV